MANSIERWGSAVSDLSARIRFVQTDMGDAAARVLGMKEASVPTKDSVAGVVAQVRLFARFMWKFC